MSLLKKYWNSFVDFRDYRTGTFRNKVDGTETHLTTNSILNHNGLLSIAGLDQMVMNAAADFGRTGFTMFVKFRVLNDLTGTHHVYSCYNKTAATPRFLIRISGGNIDFTAVADNGTSVIITSLITEKLQKDYVICVTLNFTTNEIRIYVNGNFSQTGNLSAMTGGLNIESGSTLGHGVGRSTDNNELLEYCGLIKGVALTAAEVAVLTSELNESIPDQLVDSKDVAFRVLGVDSTTVLALQGDYPKDLSASNNDIALYDRKIVGEERNGQPFFTFDSTVGSYGIAASSANLNPNYGDWLVAFTFRYNGVSNQYPNIIGDRPWTSGVDKGWAIAFFNTDYTRLATHFADGANGWDVANAEYATETGVISPYVWYRIIVIFDRSNEKLKYYLNGILIKEISWVIGLKPTGIITSTAGVWISQDKAGGNRRLAMSISEVIIKNDLSNVDQNWITKDYERYLSKIIFKGEMHALANGRTISSGFLENTGWNVVTGNALVITEKVDSSFCKIIKSTAGNILSFKRLNPYGQYHAKLYLNQSGVSYFVVNSRDDSINSAGQINIRIPNDGSYSLRISGSVVATVAAGTLPKQQWFDLDFYLLGDRIKIDVNNVNKTNYAYSTPIVGDRVLIQQDINDKLIWSSENHLYDFYLKA